MVQWFYTFPPLLSDWEKNFNDIYQIFFFVYSTRLNSDVE